MTSLYQRSRQKAKQLGVRRVVDLITRRAPWSSTWESVGFRRDLTVPFSAPEAKVPISVRAMDDALAKQMFDLTESGITEDERELRKSRGELWESGIGFGFVAVAEDGDPAYCQWLIGPEFNDDIRQFFDEVFPVLGQGEALLEGAFTPEAHRGKGIMPAAMARIAEHGADVGATSVITFVTADNVPSIKGCERSGFAAYTRRLVVWNGLRRSVTFEPL